MKLAMAWELLTNLDRAKEVGKTLPPQPVRGRWLSANACEERLIKAGQTETSAAFKLAIASKSESAASAASAVASTGFQNQFLNEVM